MDPSKIFLTTKFRSIFSGGAKKKKKKKTTAGAVDHNVQPSVKKRKDMLKEASKP